jgi:hypothetical protein
MVDPSARGNRYQHRREAETPCVPPCSASSLIQAVSSTAQSHRPSEQEERSRVATPKLSSGAGQPTITLRTSLDGTDDGGGISESSGVSKEAADPRSKSPSALKELRSSSQAARNEQPSTPRRGLPRPCTRSDGRPRRPASSQAKPHLAQHSRRPRLARSSCSAFLLDLRSE